MKLADWLSLIGFAIALAILWRFRQIVLLLFAAMVIAIALNSFVRRWMGWLRCSRGRAVGLTLATVAVGAGIFIVLVLPLFVSQFEQVLELIPRGVNRLRSLSLDFLESPPTWLPEQARQWEIPQFTDLITQFLEVGGQFFGNFFSVFSAYLGTLLQLILLVVITLMLLSDPLAYRRLLLRLFPRGYRRRADDILDKCEVALLSWLGGVALNSLFVACLSFVGLLLLGVPFPFANAVLAGIFNFVPNIGPALSGVFPVIVALSQSVGSAIAVMILYVVIQNLESYWFSPMVMHKQTSLLPAATLIAQIFFATFLGPTGLVLALPLTVVCKTWLEEAWVIDILDRDRTAPAPLASIAPSTAAPVPAAATDPSLAEPGD